MKKALLAGLNYDFTVIARIIQTTNATYVDAVSQLIIHDANRLEATEKECKALLTMPQKNYHNTTCYFCKMKGHTSARCFFNSDSKIKHGISPGIRHRKAVTQKVRLIIIRKQQLFQ